jgi:hypothetical protein
MSTQTKDSAIHRFNAISWHDSKLVGLSFYRKGEEEQIKVSLEILGESGDLRPAEIVFRECAYVEAEVYLEAKRMCSDDITDAECSPSSDWKKAISEPGPYDVIRGDRHLEEYLHFRISLCPPGGTINVLAKDFALAFAASV